MGCEGYDISEFAVKNALHPRVRHIRSLTEVRRTYRTVRLISVLEHIPLDNLDSFLAEVADLTKQFIAACIPIFPGNVLDFFDNGPIHVILEHREWWDAAFARQSFVPLPVPTEPLPFIMPFLYRRQS